MAGLKESTRVELLELGRQKAFLPGETLYRIGDPPDGLHGLIDGRVSLSVPNDSGSVFDCHIGTAGFWVGDMALFSKGNRLITVTAITEVRTWFLPQAALLKAIQARPDLVADFYALAHYSMSIALRLLANLAIPDAAPRVAAWLLFVDESAAEPGQWIEASQEQVGRMNALSLPTARRVLKRMTDQGLVELGYGRLRVLDRARLSDFCAS
ncbi:Crp/Fnr family transcriptional regulator [Sedimentitalea arenosa]|uniref:Crp/Fnr family transcriptional regulator n=1 Tax=Sedimentitalea arenosa TaxID=2798803 RepID=A0A8J7J650_9RHOB|nr:Crp/Fnr family transcriptional regulator [Arenibacterium arenosum]MBJ6372200.1 Crp/Fnr family transcriptional regulator [Arenibacterium arenosum]